MLEDWQKDPQTKTEIGQRQAITDFPKKWVRASDGIPAKTKGAIGKSLFRSSTKYAVSNVVGFIKGKSAISIARQFMGKAKNFTGENFWARGYFVSTVGLDEEVVRAYIREQEQEDERYEQLSLLK